MASTHPLTHEFEQIFQAYIHSRLSEKNQLNEAMKYSLLSGGKRIRPQLLLESAQLTSLSKPIALQCAIAIEIVHAFSLVHDDLPCMDNDDYRRGIPTTHKKFGEALALLTGDALLNLAHETFLSCLKGVSTESYFRSFQLFTQATESMILGQAEELNFDGSNLNELLRIQSLKTGKLFKASILCPLLLSGISTQEPTYLECESFADAFGFAFQIADDLEDENQDQKMNTKNILSHLGRASAIELAQKKLLESEISHHFSATKVLLTKLTK